MGTISHDLRFAIRQIRRAPFLSLFIVTTLAIGIGMSTAMFSVLDTMLLRPIYHEEQQLVRIHGAYKDRGDEWSVSLPNAADWGSRSHSFSEVAWYQTVSTTLTEGSTPDRINVVAVTPNLFHVLGVTPLIGRTIEAPNAQPDGPRVAILSYGLWQTRFAGDSAVIGKTIGMNGRPAIIIGVMRPAFSFPNADVGAYMALRASPATWFRGNGGLSVVARLRRGVDAAAAQRDLDVISRRMADEYPTTNKDLSAKVRPFRDVLVGPEFTKATYFLSGAVILVLLIACVNVANLLLSRAVEREREIAVRAAVGASRTRIVVQLLTEGIVLSLVGGLGGVAIASVSLRALPKFIPSNLELPTSFALDWRVLATGLGMTIVAGIAFSALPSIKATRLHLNSLIGGRGTRLGRHHRNTQGLLVIIQVALALILVTSTGLATQGLQHLLQTSPGFRVENLLTARLPFDGVYRDTSEARLLEQRLLAEMRAIPGVEQASLVDFAPLSGGNNFSDIVIEGGKPANAGTIMVGPDYLRTMGIPLIRGRDLGSRDGPDNTPVVVVNRAFANKFFPGADAIGKRMLFNWDRGSTPNWRTIVGVYENVLQVGLDTRKYPRRVELAVPLAQLPFTLGDVGVVVRGQGDPTSLVAPLRHAVRKVAPTLPVFEIRTMENLVNRTSDVVLSRFLAWVLAIFGATAMLLAALGLYGVVSHSVSARTFEIGVRTALGADRAAVVWMVVGQGLTLVVIGVVSGVAGASASSRVLQSLLHGVPGTDPFVLGGTVALVVAVGALATVHPALRASRISPTEAIRNN